MFGRGVALGRLYNSPKSPRWTVNSKGLDPSRPFHLQFLAQTAFTTPCSPCPGDLCWEWLRNPTADVAYTPLGCRCEGGPHTGSSRKFSNLVTLGYMPAIFLPPAPVEPDAQLRTPSTSVLC